MCKMLLSIVFSFRNEEEVLPALIQRVTNTLSSLTIDYELIFINDDSVDKSLEILAKYARNSKHIKVINMSRRFGGSACVMAGFKCAKGDAIIYMDTDLQDPPEVIPQMIEKFKNGAEVVNMTRMEREGESVFKMWVTKMAYKLINVIAEIDLPENTGDFKLLSRRVVNEVLKLNEHDPFMRGLVRWVGFNQETIYYKREARFSGETHYPLFGTGPIKEFIRGITSFSALPLYFSLFLSFLVSFGAFTYLMIVIITKYMGINIPGWSALMATMLFLGGTILFAVGVIGIYISRIYSEVKSRPKYIIKDTINFEDQ